jgi:hypothetical protein
MQDGNDSQVEANRALAEKSLIPVGSCKHTSRTLPFPLSNRLSFGWQWSPPTLMVKYRSSELDRLSSQAQELSSWMSFIYPLLLSSLLTVERPLEIHRFTAMLFHLLTPHGIVVPCTCIRRFLYKLLSLLAAIG